uniref:Putative cystatin n=1 Tax=Rhipicephalus microplus TaxID=6941 RepID=A0A6G5A7G2_RHIMP
MTGIPSVVLIFCLAAVTNANWETVRRSTSGLVGGWREHKYPSESQKFITLAYQAFADALGEPYLHGTNLRVSKASTQVVAGLNHKLEVEQTQVSCGFKRPPFPGAWQNPNSLVCFTGKVIAVCTIEYFIPIKTSTPNITSFECKKPFFEE